MRAAAVFMLVAACGAPDRSTLPPAPSQPRPGASESTEPAPKPRPSSSTATCEDAADATIRILARVFPDQPPAGRQGLIDQCGAHPWDDDERRCVLAAESLRDDKELLGAVGRCHIDGDCRRHPDRPTCNSR